VLCRKVRRAVSGERGGLELQRKRRRATEGVRGHVVYGLALSADGRRGSAANAMRRESAFKERKHLQACCAGRSRAEAVTAKNCGIGKRSRERELFDPPSEAGYERRCRVAPQA